MIVIRNGNGASCDIKFRFPTFMRRLPWLPIDFLRLSSSLRLQMRRILNVMIVKIRLREKEKEFLSFRNTHFEMSLFSFVIVL